MSATTASRNPHDLYELLDAARVDKDGLPAQDALEGIASSLHGVLEFLIEPVATATAKASNNGTISPEDVGRLVIWADYVHDLAGNIIDAAAKVNVAAHESWESESLFTENGYVRNQDRFDRCLRRFVEA